MQQNRAEKRMKRHRKRGKKDENKLTGGKEDWEKWIYGKIGWWERDKMEKNMKIIKQGKDDEEKKSKGKGMEGN